MANDPIRSWLTPAAPCRRWLRILSVLDACRWSGLTPILTSSMHVIAYLSEALAPAWHLPPIDGKVLKLPVAPYYPTLKQDVDRLIGMGLIRVDSLETGRDDADNPVLQPRISLELERVGPILGALRELPGENEIVEFLREVVQAFSRLSDEQIPGAMAQDATYGSPAVDTGQVIDLGEWLPVEETATSRAVERMRHLATAGVHPAELVDMYVDHICYRVGNERR